MLTTVEYLSLLREYMRKNSAKYGISRMGIFGSVARGEPAEFPVNGVIPGWIEALTLMPVGSKWELTIPQELAYGERGAGASIPPFSTLVFEVELLEIL